MNLKRFCLALTAVAMLAAIAVSSASAAMTTEGEWYVNGTTLPVGTEKKVTCEVGEHNGEKKLVLTGSVGENHVPVKLTATGIDCVGTIFNETSGSKVIGKDKGHLIFTHVTVSEPTGCTVEGETVETNELKSELYMDSGSTHAFDKFEPAVAGGNFAVVHILGSCAAAGNRPVKGFVYGESTNETGISATNQPLTFSPAIEETTGSELLFAGNPAHLTGQVINMLESDESFSAHN